MVLAASYEARALGVRGAMGGRQARQLCPGRDRGHAPLQGLRAGQQAVFAVFEDTAPVVEGISLEEAFLDVRGLERICGSPRRIAERLRSADARRGRAAAQRRAWRAPSTWPRWPAAAAKPDGLLVVPADGRRSPSCTRCRSRRCGASARPRRRKLHERGIHRVEHLAAVPGAALAAMLGRAAGWHLHAIANNRDPRPVRARRRRRSLGSQSALGSRPRTPGRAGRGAHGAGRPGHAPDALQGPGRADGHAAPALRRLHPRRALAHAGPGHGRHRGHPARPPRAVRRRTPADRRPRPDAAGADVHQPRATCATACSWRCRWSPGAPPELDEVVDRVRERFGAGAVTRGRAAARPGARRRRWSARPIWTSDSMAA